jgi:uncharacterized membrane protein
MSKRPTPTIDLVCVLALTLEWLIFGSCHFAFHEATVLQIPPYFPLKSLIVVFTGIVEVVTGILILLPSTRKWAALTSLFLLVVFIPSIIHLLIDDTAIKSFGVDSRVMRVILVLNHIFLFLCALHLWRSPEAWTMTMPEMIEGFLTASGRQPVRSGVLLIAIIMLAANTAGFLCVFISPWDRTLACLWAMMCLATGALVGFLFGVPKVSQKAVLSTTHRPNSNIEVVSDWLTKIIVGVGLVQFHKIGGALNEASSDLGKSLALKTNGPVEVAASFAQALIIYFFVAGMIQGYLLTRMYLSSQFTIAEPLVENPKEEAAM